MSRSPVRSRARRSISRSPRSNHVRNNSRSASPDESPKRIRRGRGFREEFLYVRRYRTPSPNRHRYGGRSARDRYSSYRGYYGRSPPRRYRSPPRYRGWRSPSRSVSRSPGGYRARARAYSRSLARSHSLRAERLRSHDDARDNIPADKQRSVSRSRSPSGSYSRSRSMSRSSPDMPSQKRTSKEKSRSPSSSSGEKKGLVSYGDGSPNSAGLQ